MQYHNYVDENSINYLKKADENKIKKNIYNIYKKLEKKSSTISRSLASIRSFYQFLIRTKLIKEDPTVNIQSPKIEKKEYQVF